MASTRKPRLAPDQGQLELQVKVDRQKLLDSLAAYQNSFGSYPLTIVDGEEKDKYDFINPEHYVQDDGRQTWEHMVDKWGEEKTALWCEMTAFKYQDRIGRKPGEDEEREKNKIKWYEDKAEELRTLAKKKTFW